MRLYSNQIAKMTCTPRPILAAHKFTNRFFKLKDEFMKRELQLYKAIQSYTKLKETFRNLDNIVRENEIRHFGFYFLILAIDSPYDFGLILVGLLSKPPRH